MTHNACYQRLLFLLLTESLHVNNHTVGKGCSSLCDNNGSRVCCTVYIIVTRHYLTLSELWITYVINNISQPCLGYFLFYLRLVYTSLWAMYVTLLLSCMVWFNLLIVWRGWGLRWSTKFDYFQIHSSNFSEMNLTFGIFSIGIICRLEYYHYFLLPGEIMIYTSERFPGKERIYCKEYLEAFWEERKQEDPLLFNNFTTNSKNDQCLETFSVIRTGGVLLSQVVQW